MKKLISLKINKDLNIKDNLVTLSAPNFIYIEKKSDIPISTRVYKDDELDGTILSVSGTIIDYVYKKINKRVVLCYQIENDFKDERSKVAKISKKYNNLKKSELIELLKEKKLDSLSWELSKDADTLVINSVDERMYEYNKIYRIKEWKTQFLESINHLKDILNIKIVYLIFKESNENVIKELVNEIGLYTDIQIKLLPNKYLVSTIYLDNYLKLNDYIQLTSDEVYEIVENIKKNKCVRDQMISIYNELTNTLSVKNIRLNSPLIEIFENEEIDFSKIDIYINGYMCGRIERNVEDLIMTEDITSIVILKKDSLVEYKCLNCGACNNVCPKNLNVKKLFDNNLQSNKCLNCGLCNYVCPANINLRSKIVGEENA